MQGGSDQRTGVFERRMSIKARLSLSLLAVLVLVLPVTALSLIYLNDMLRTVDRMARVDARIAAIAQGVEAHVFTARDAEKNYLIFRDETYAERNRAEMAGVEALIDSLSNVPPEELSPNLSLEEVARIRRSLESYVTTFDLLASRWLARPGLSALRLAPEDREMRKLMTDLNNAGDEMIHLSSEVVRRSWDHIDAAREKVGRTRARAERNILTMLMLTVLGGLYLIVVLPRRVVLPVRRLMNVIRKVEEGDLDASTDRVSHDELGDMALAFNRMMEQIRTFDALKVEKISELYGRLDALAGEIREGALVVELEGALTFANERAFEMTGWARRGAIGTPIHRVDEGGPIAEAVSESLRTRQPVSERQAMLPRTGEEVKLSVRPVRNREGRILSVIVVMDG